MPRKSTHKVANNLTSLLCFSSRINQSTHIQHGSVLVIAMILVLLFFMLRYSSGLVFRDLDKPNARNLIVNDVIKTMKDMSTAAERVIRKSARRIPTKARSPTESTYSEDYTVSEMRFGPDVEDEEDDDESDFDSDAEDKYN